MAFQLKNPVEQEFVLFELDPDGEAKIKFRQTTAKENQVRDRLVFGPQRRTFGLEGIEVSNAVPWSVRQEIEVRLTICGTEGILAPDGSPLFRFKQRGSRTELDMTPDEFHEAWGKIHSQRVCDIFWGHCLDVNPDWDWRPKESKDENPPAAVENGSG